MRSKSLNYMPALDGLRAVAVLMVFFSHALPGGFDPGGLGVDVFFVISGFLITRILLRQLEQTGTVGLPTFYVRRLLRLYPAQLFMVVGVLLFFVVQIGGIPTDRVTYAAVTLAYVSNIYTTMTGHMMEPFSHTWSLAMEEQFYLVWPAVLWVFHRLGLSRQTMMLILAVATAASFVGWVATADQQPFNPLTKAGGLLVGCIVAIAVAKGKWFSKPAGYVAAALFVAVIVADRADLINGSLSAPLVVLTLPFIILLAAFGDGPLVAALSTRLVVRLGVVSYGFYLWHYPILFVLHTRAGVDGWAGVLVGLVCTVIAAEFSFRVVERPALRLRDRRQTRRHASVDRGDDDQTGAAGSAARAVGGPPLHRTSG